MSYNRRGRRHYRVAEEKIQHDHQRGVFVPEKQKVKIVSIAILILILAFLKGVVFGYICEKNCDK